MDSFTRKCRYSAGKTRQRSGFTVLELLVVISIIGVLAAFAVPRFLSSVERSKAAEAFNYLATVHSSMERYHARQGIYADALVDLDVGLGSPEYFSVGPVGVPASEADLQTARLISAEAVKQTRTVECHFLIDTGMGRLGILLKDAAKTIREVVALDGLNCNGIYSHFPFAYGDYDFSCHQVTAFVGLLEKLSGEGITFEHVHMANSDGIHNIESAVKHPFTMARTGINLYGCFDLEGRKTLPLQEVLTLKSRLVGIRDMPWGSSLGYGRTVTLDKPTRVGTVSIGYADGLPLSMSGNGKVTEFTFLT